MSHCEVGLQKKPTIIIVLHYRKHKVART